MTTLAENDDFEHSPPLIFTESAARKVWSLIQEEANPNLKLRVFISGGGCSGFQYGFTFDEEVKEDDLSIEKQFNEGEKQGEDNGDAETTVTPRVTLLVDSMSLQYLTGATIDYKEDLEGAQFIIRNPNAQTTCGCGSSFSV